MKLQLLLTGYLLGLAQLSSLPAVAPKSVDPAVETQWGNSELRLILNDLPSLKPLIKEKSVVWNWIAAALNAKNEGYLIKWDPNGTSKLTPASAESSTFPDDNGLSYIRINATGEKKGQASFIDFLRIRE